MLAVKFHRRKQSMRADKRLATPSDAETCSRIVIAGWRDSYADFLPAALLAGLDRNPHHDVGAWRKLIAAPSSWTWIMSKEHGGDIGIVRLDLNSSIPGTRTELTTLYIDAAWRGRGLGRHLLNVALQEARRLEAVPMGLTILSGNHRGRRFYERHGARLLSERTAFEWEGRTVPEIVYSMEGLD
jgi:GNAT superfamily N-acetyltransferase